jgi:anti-sigma-K factor RskA
MTAMTCAQAEDLLGAHALDALTPQEARDVQEHLRGCAEHRQTAQELAQTVSLLALAVDEREPAPDLRDRIMASIQSPSPDPVQKPAPGPVVVPIRRVPRLPRWAPRPAWAAVAAGVLLILGIGTYAGYRLGKESSQAVAYRFAGNALAPGARANLVYLRDKHQAVLAVSGLQPLPSGQVYEMWLVKNSGQAVDQGVATAPDGRITAQMAADLSQFKQFAITIESGERPAPTTPPVLAGSLTGGSA